MMSPGNLPPNAYQMQSRAMRIPMRHTFSLDQKRILMKYFEQGMVGQSLMYQEKIQQCAQEAQLEFDVVRNWIGNQRRKRRLEEVQKACMQTYMDGPHGEFPEGLSPAKMPTMSMGPRQTQMLFLPHMAKQHPQSTMQPHQPHPAALPTLPGLPTETTNHGPDGTLGDGHAPQVAPLALTHAATSMPSHHQPGMPPAMQSAPHHSPRMPVPNRVIAPYHHAPPPVSGYPSGGGIPPSTEVGVGDLQNQPMHVSQPPPLPPPPPQRSNHSSPASQTTSPSASGAGSMTQDEEIGYHQTPIRGFFPAPRGARMPIPGNAHPVQPQQRISPSSFLMYPPVKMVSTKESSEIRHHEIRRIVEQIQMRLDRLEQLGCESLLATVSTADRSAYVCGTPIALQYFSQVNKDLPMAEFIHKQVSGDGEFDRDVGLDKSPSTEEATAEDLREGETENAKNGKGDATNSIGQAAEGQTVMKVGAEMLHDEDDELGMMDDGDGIIKAGDEVYIVSKDRSIIGTGLLYARPHEKMVFKNSPDYAE